MAFEFRLPDIGEGVVEGEVIKWHVKPGDRVREDQPMVEVMTDKATVEIPAPRAGVVREIRAPEGKTCAVGAVMVVIDDAGGKGEGAGAPATSAHPATAPASSGHASSGQAPSGARAAGAPSASGPKVLATPATRKLARDLGVELSVVTPSGDNGRVTSEDVRRAANGGAAGHAESQKAGFEARPASRATGVDQRIPFRGVRKKIAENMHRSLKTAAHFTYVDECDATELVALRARAKERADERGLKLSYLPFIIKAVCGALKKFPIVNASLDEAAQEIVLHQRCHVGVATATEAGLTVPVLRDADQKSLFDLARELEAISERVRTGKASRDDLTGSTFTISSLGALGGLHATPIINFPEVAILGVHKIKQMPVVRDGAIAIRDIMNLSISLDHRIVDGHEGARFLAHVIGLLEDPTLMFMEMV